jgi:hypothetical protein
MLWGRRISFGISLCLSRACLGKMILFSIKWHRKRDAFLVFVPVGTVPPPIASRIPPLPSSAFASPSGRRSIASCESNTYRFQRRLSRACLGKKSIFFSVVCPEPVLGRLKTRWLSHRCFVGRDHRLQRCLDARNARWVRLTTTQTKRNVLWIRFPSVCQTRACLGK